MDRQYSQQTDARSPDPHVAPLRLPPLHINTAAPASTPVTTTSYIPGPGPVISPRSLAPGQQAPHGFTSSPLLASLHASTPSPQPVSLPTASSSHPSNSDGPNPTVNPGPAPDPSGEQPHSFDDCPACRAEYAAAVAASLDAEAQHRRAEEERERRELEDAIRLSERDAQTQPHRPPEEDEDELMRRAIAESERNAALEEQRRGWRQDLQQLGMGSSSGASTSTANQPVDEDEILRRVMAECAQAEDEARRRREQEAEWEADVVERSRRTAELVEQQRYLEVQEASMWRPPNAGGRAGSSASSSKAREALGSVGGNPSDGAADSARPDAEAGDRNNGKGKEESDYSLDLALRASRRPPEPPPGMSQEDFAKAVAMEARGRMEAREDAPRIGRSQEEENSFWRNPAAVPSSQPKSPSAATNPQTGGTPQAVAVSAGDLQRLQSAAVTSEGDDGSRTMSLPPVIIESSTDETQTGSQLNSRGIDAPDSVTGSLPPQHGQADRDESEAAPVAGPENGGPAGRLSHAHAPSGLSSAPVPQETKEDPQSPLGLPDRASAPAAPSISAALDSLDDPQPLPVHADPSADPQISRTATLLQAQADSVDETLAEQLHSNAALETPLEAQSQDSPAATPPRLLLSDTRPVNENVSHSLTQDTRAGPVTETVPSDILTDDDTQLHTPVDAGVSRSQADAPLDVDADSLADSYARSSLHLRRTQSSVLGPELPESDTDVTSVNDGGLGDETPLRGLSALPDVTSQDAAGPSSAQPTGGDSSHEERSAVTGGLIPRQIDSQPPVSETSTATSITPQGANDRMGTQSAPDQSPQAFSPVRHDTSGHSSQNAGAATTGTSSPQSSGSFALHGSNPLLAGVSSAFTAPIMQAPSSTPNGANTPSSPLYASQHSRSPTSPPVTRFGTSSGSGGGHAFVQQNGSAIRPASAAGRWSGEPQIAIALRRTSGAGAGAGGGGTTTTSGSHPIGSPSGLTGSSVSFLHQSSVGSGAAGGHAATGAGRMSIGSSGAASGSGSGFSLTTTSPSAGFNPLFSAFGSEAEDASRTASAAAAAAPIARLPREHIGGWAGASTAPAPASGPFPYIPKGSTLSEPAPYPMASFAPVVSAGPPSHPQYGAGPAYASSSSAMGPPPLPGPTTPSDFPSTSGLDASIKSSPSSVGKAKKKLKSLFSRHDRTGSKTSSLRASVVAIPAPSGEGRQAGDANATSGAVADPPFPSDDRKGEASSIATTTTGVPADTASIHSASGGGGGRRSLSMPWLHHKTAASGSRTSLASTSAGSTRRSSLFGWGRGGGGGGDGPDPSSSMMAAGDAVVPASETRVEDSVEELR
ncbi:hypothetical protein V8E36_005641 [Tilletia maclaganii]